MTLKPKPTIITALIFSVGCFLLGLYFGSDTVEVVGTNDVELKLRYAALDSINEGLEVKADSLSKLVLKSKETKIKYVNKYIEVKRSITTEDSLNCPDVVDKFNSLVSACDSLNNSNDTIIGQLEAKVITLESIITTQEQQLGIKDSIIDINQQNYEKAIKKEKRKKWLFGGGGILTGFILGSLK